MKHDHLTAMPDGLAGGLDFFHLALFTPGLAWPCALAFAVGVLIERRDWDPLDAGWLFVVAAVILTIAAGITTALLVAFVVSLWILFGWLGMRYEDMRARLAALERRWR